jgi:hypothetical protein
MARASTLPVRATTPSRPPPLCSRAWRSAAGDQRARRPAARALPGPAPAPSLGGRASMRLHPHQAAASLCSGGRALPCSRARRTAACAPGNPRPPWPHVCTFPRQPRPSAPVTAALCSRARVRLDTDRMGLSPSGVHVDEMKPREATIWLHPFPDICESTS